MRVTNRRDKRALEQEVNQSVMVGQQADVAAAAVISSSCLLQPLVEAAALA